MAVRLAEKPVESARRLFGTDGIRGVANVWPMTGELMLQLGRAVAYLIKSGPHRHRVVIGKDTRVSGYMLETALASGLCSMGVDVLLCGPLPTPVLRPVSVVILICGRPLPGTVWDPLYPDSDGRPMGDTDYHSIAMVFLREAFEDLFVARRQSVIVNLALGDPDSRRLLGSLMTVGAEQAEPGLVSDHPANSAVRSPASPPPNGPATSGLGPNLG